jgi:hypothetical protein
VVSLYFALKYIPSRNGDSAVCIAIGYGLDGQGVGVQVLIRARFSFLRIVQTSSRAHPTSYPMGAGRAVSPGVKQLGHEADHSPPNNAEVKNLYGSTHPLPPMSSWHSA